MYRGKDFQAIGPHQWRHRKKLNNIIEPNEPKMALKMDSEPVSGCNIVKCTCAKECKGMKGLKCTKGNVQPWITSNFVKHHKLDIQILTPAKNNFLHSFVLFKLRLKEYYNYKCKLDILV